MVAMKIGLLFFCLLLGACADRENASRASAGTAGVSPARPAWRFWEFAFPARPLVRVASPLVEVGSIRLVNATEGFVLIDATRRSMLSPRTGLVVIEGGERVAVLKMTDLQAPPFVIADIVSGSPSAGQRVQLLESAHETPRKP